MINYLNTLYDEHSIQLLIYGATHLEQVGWHSKQLKEIKSLQILY